MIHELRPETPEVALEHYGAKGMHWGVRKDEGSSSPTIASKQPMSTERKKEIAKKVAIGTGVLLVAAGTAYVAYSMKKNGNLSLKNLSSSTSGKGKIAVAAVVKEPTDIIHATRGKSVGFRFLKKGGVPDPLSEYESAFLVNGQETAGEMFKRYGSAGAEKIAVRFMDPEGRKDQAGRLIPHDVIIPSVMTPGINSKADVIAKIWPKLKPDYDVLYSGVSKDYGGR